MQTTTVATISPPERVARSLPLNFQPGDEALFQHELVKDIDAVKSLTMKDVHLLPNGFLSSGIRVLPQSFTSIPKGFPAIKRWIRMIAYQAVAKKTKDVERALFATDEFSNGYFHWICDVLPRIEAIYNPGDSSTDFPGPCHGNVSLRCAQFGALRFFQRLHLFLERKDSMLRSPGRDSGGTYGKLSAVVDESLEKQAPNSLWRRRGGPQALHQQSPRPETAHSE